MLKSVCSMTVTEQYSPNRTTSLMLLRWSFENGLGPPEFGQPKLRLTLRQYFS